MNRNTQNSGLTLECRDESIGFFRLVFPAIDELAGADEDALARCWHPVSLDVWASDVADTPLRCGQQAKDRKRGQTGDWNPDCTYPTSGSEMCYRCEPTV